MRYFVGKDENLTGEDEVGVPADQISIHPVDPRPVPGDAAEVFGLKAIRSDRPE
jgi:hypothetical protein